MNAPRPTGWLRAGALLALTPLLLLAGWLYLYAHSHAVDPAEQNHLQAQLERLKQLDADWSADVLRSHADLDPSYDALAAPLARFDEGLAALRTRAAAAHDAALDDAVAELAAAVDAKSALVDAFKAQNSLYKNSLRYVPTAHEAIAAQPRDGADALRAALARLVNLSLRHSAVPDAEVAAGLRRGIDELRGALAAAPATLREPAANLLSHLDTLLRLRANQGELLRSVSQVPVAARIDRLGALFTQHFDARLASQFAYQRLLLAYSAVALLLVFGGAGFIGYRNATERRRLRALVDEQTRELKELATRDDLTRVHNRRHLGELLAQQQALHARSGLPLCIALLDIDLFKSINDRFGHAAGDAVLVRFATTTRDNLRVIDLLGRWGGEEFLLALPQTSPDQAELALGRIRAALQRADFSDLGAGLQVTFSGGLALLRPDEPIAAAVERADQAMYRAKTGGRDRVERG